MNPNIIVILRPFSDPRNDKKGAIVKQKQVLYHCYQIFCKANINSFTSQNEDVFAH